MFIWHKKRRFLVSVKSKRNEGFTLVELLVSMAVLAMLMVIIAGVVSTVQRSWRATTAKVAQFREARRAYDILKRNLSQATLNTYVRYRYTGTSDPYTPFDAKGQMTEGAAPSAYEPYSELQFICGPVTQLLSAAQSDTNPGHAVFFQALLGFSAAYPNLPTALNARGYFVQFGNDASYVPDFVASRSSPKYRYRLMEYAPTTEHNKIYDSNTIDTQGDWFQDALPAGNDTRPIAENVVALYLSPKRPIQDKTGDPRDIAPKYFYDSTKPAGTSTGTVGSYELPPEIEIVMVVLDEASAFKLATEKGSAAPLRFSGFTSATNQEFRSDLSAMEKTLIDEKVNYRIFSSTVALSNSKWKG